jgi:hypothetical protein
MCNKNPCPLFDGWICCFCLFHQAVSTCCTLYAPLFTCDSLYGSVMIRVHMAKFSLPFIHHGVGGSSLLIAQKSYSVSWRCLSANTSII